MTAGWGRVEDVPGVRVGHADRRGDGWLTGVTVLLPPPGTVGAVDVRGGGPGTHETDALDPSSLVPTVDAVVLTGGSAYGLAAAGGAQRWCEEQGRGFPVGPPGDPGALVVPIVPAAAVFDLGRGGDPAARPDAAMGYAAAAAAGAAQGPAATGCIGAGTGTQLALGTLKGGVGSASVRLPGGFVVGALAVVNAVGSPLDPVTGALLGTAFVPPGLPRPPAPDPAEHAAPAAAGSAAGQPPVPGANTTLAVVVTDAPLDPAGLRRVAVCGHDGLARSLSPVHTLMDGDTVFALSTTGPGTPAGSPALRPEQAFAVHAAAADAVLLAVLDAVLAATRTTTAAGPLPGYLDRYPSARLTAP